MSGVVKVTPDLATRAAAEIDWEKIDAMTDEDIARQVADNPDAPPLFTDEEWERVDYGERLRRMRARLRLSQPAFADRYRIPVGSLRDWEQGRFLPDAATRAYLLVIEKEPEMVARTLVA